MKNVNILVPTDFTPVGDCALQHAVKLARFFENNITLLHVVPAQKDVEGATAKLNTAIKKEKDKSSLSISPLVRVGNIFDDIGDAASAVGAKLIIMGTHGVKGIQNITGSYALKVITNSKVPFIVVQKKAMREGYNNIVLPLNLSQNTKQKLTLAVEIAKSFNSKVHIITPNEKDEFLKRQLKANMAFAAKYLKENKIGFTTNISEGKSGNFASDVIKFAAANDADLISMVNFEGGGLLNMFGSGYEQKILANEAQIPVMCVNPVSTTRSTGSVFS